MRVSWFVPAQRAARPRQTGERLHSGVIRPSDTADVVQNSWTAAATSDVRRGDPDTGVITRERRMLARESGPAGGKGRAERHLGASHLPGAMGQTVSGLWG
jgi:hypothetical protein